MAEILVTWCYNHHLTISTNKPIKHVVDCTTSNMNVAQQELDIRNFFFSRHVQPNNQLKQIQFIFKSTPMFGT